MGQEKSSSTKLGYKMVYEALPRTEDSVKHGLDHVPVLRSASTCAFIRKIPLIGKVLIWEDQSYDGSIYGGIFLCHQSVKSSLGVVNKAKQVEEKKWPSLAR